MDDKQKVFERVACISDIPKRRGIVRIVNGHEIAIFQVDGKYYAVSNICPHQHSPVIADGMLENKIITCPLHGWSYYLDTGESTGGARGLDSYKIKITGEDIFVEQPETPPEPAW